MTESFWEAKTRSVTSNSPRRFNAVLSLHLVLILIQRSPAYTLHNLSFLRYVIRVSDHLCGLVARVLGYRSGGPGSIPGTTRKKKVVGLERGPLSLVSTTEELLDRKVAAPV
jgi:hypothetical protein